MPITHPEYILALDQGTTGTRAVIFNHNTRRVITASTPLNSHTPHSGWQEQRPADIWEGVQTVIGDALINAGINASDIKAIGIASQRETTIVWNKDTGEPIYNAISWASLQSEKIATHYLQAGYGDLIHQKTGLNINPYYSATKIRWILDNVPGAKALAAKGKLAFGNVDSWIVWQLTDGKKHVTDSSNAARTMLFNIHTQEWDQELLDIFDIPRDMLPEVHASSEVVAETSPLHFFGNAVPIACLIGDQNASLIGQLGTHPGDIKATYGAGAFLLLNTGTQPVLSDKNLTTTIAYQIGDETVYALDGAVFSAGIALQWLHNSLEMIDNQVDSWHAAEASTNHNEIYMVPAFNGLGAPYWDPQARGSIVGLTRNSTKNDLIKATLQSIAYQTADILKLMDQESVIKPTALKADGSVSRNPYLMQFQADIANLPVHRAMDEDTTAMGAAYLAGIAVGYWHSVADLEHHVLAGRQFEPEIDNKTRQRLLRGWHAAVKTTEIFADD
ncbi:glycerol kinase [Weissella uvarum]|uniref:glycerol kinase GlpK n=1 Tax=Weissella uvarum TaxID=1479233 RepID=UPI00196217D7|nr:glycerol kinase GlpK [Weissella uvarum]MBM7617640.1 glycerol kinase [Weissella uvarum]MCM0595989.1 glycerol kinase GlpK [Weissella uvarum]